MGWAVSVALLRGINVGGKNRLPMKELAALFVKAGCVDVRTYIQSGNVLFRADPKLAAEVPSLIVNAILAGFGYKVPVVTRESQELQDIVQANPFLDARTEADKLHVLFLADLPEAAHVAALDPNRSPDDEFAVLGREGLSELSERNRAHQAHHHLLRLQALHNQHYAKLENGAETPGTGHSDGVMRSDRSQRSLTRWIRMQPVPWSGHTRSE